uniref:Serine/threonine-protein phosphatase 4 regulatory subunit 4 n=3 Tax=Photinus pyralis TaxID=7054 RepID=A0A1Y1KKB2_PHOPY
MDKESRYIFDLNLDSLDLVGDDIQKLSVIQNLPQLLQTDPNQTYSRIIPKILQELPNASCEFHVLVSKAFKILMEKQAPPNLFHTVLQGIDVRDSIAASAWMDTLIAIIPVLSETQIKQEIIRLVNHKSLLSQPVLSRIASCKLLGKIAVHKDLDSTDVKRDVLPLAQSLCQDCHPEVRTVMCSQLAHVAQGLGTSLVKGTLLASLVELGSDENMYVRAASVSSIVQIFPYSSLDVKKATLLPLLKQLCERSLKQDELTPATLSKEIGRIFEGLQHAFTATEALWFLNFYKKLATKGLVSEGGELTGADPNMEVTCRQHAAVNLPMVSSFTFAVLPTQTDTLYTIFTGLAADPCYIVRRTVAGCLSAVINIFGVNSKILKKDFVRLLQDDSEEVLSSLVQQLGVTLELFAQYGTLSRQTASPDTVDIGRAMLKCQFELTSGNNWRLLMHLLHQLEYLPNCMPPDFIHQHFTPFVLNCAVQGRARPVRAQAVRTLLIFLRYNGKEMQRRWLRDNLVQQLCRSDSYYTRLIYIRLCKSAIEIFSDKYFKDYFFDHLLDLAGDPVPNIRLCVANLFAFLKQMLVLPEDKLLNERLNDAMRKYANDEEDRDVIQVFQSKMKEMKNVSTDAKDEYKKEQKRRREEEDKINSGSKPMVIVADIRTLSPSSANLHGDRSRKAATGVSSKTSVQGSPRCVTDKSVQLIERFVL